MKKKLQLLMFLGISLKALSQTTTISGKIINSKNDPVAGAIIQIKDNQTKTISENDGSFTLKVVNLNSILIIKSIGYKQQEYNLNGKTIVEITLEDDPKSLKEVDVKGFANTNSQARRRAESLQKIPESVVTFTKEDLDIRGINNINSFATFIPNVSFSASQNIGTNFLTIRGIPTIRNGESPAAIVVDGVTIQDPNLLNQDLYDMAMIEVVKGPQGALYGKNAIAGAINFLTESPINTFKNKIQLGYAKGNEYKVDFSGSGPIINNKLLYKVAGVYSKFDGVFYNEFVNKRPDFSKNYSFRGELRYHISPVVSTTLTGQYMNSTGGAIYYAHARNGQQLPSNDYNAVINSDVFGDGYLKNGFGSLKIEANLEKIKLQSITSYNNAKRFFFGDFDYIPTPFLKDDQTSNSETFNQEFRVMSKNNESKLTWSAGAFYQNSKKPLITNGYIWNGSNYELTNLGRFLGVMPDNVPISNYINTFNTVALFGFTDYKIINKLTLSLGFRFDNDKISQQNFVTDINPNRIEAQFQPKVSLSFQASPNMLFFVNYGRGYRSGGYNQDFTSVFDASYRSETTNNYEFGFKTSAWNDRLIFNSSFFYIDFRNQQQYIAIFGAKGLLIGNYNYSKSKSLGFESELKLRLSKYFDILASYGSTEAKIINGGKAGSTDRSSFNGNWIPFVPANSFSMAAQSSIPISEKIKFVGMINFNGKGKIYWHDDNKDVNPSYYLVDARLGISTKNFDFNVYGNNIFNKKYYIEYYSGEISGSVAGDLSWFGKPSIFGATATFKF